ncbi:MAG: M20/M25/M40 family metallo-hydrolase, partial [Pyrinomonadaceae bacterium]|nr:M20/M25/M40 family metallo-hydrolase [Phycisphaerales bacterium]
PSTGKILTENGGLWQPAMDLEFTAYAWSSGTKGAVRGPVVKLPTSEEEYNAVKSKLKGSWIMLSTPEGTGQQRAGVMGARYQSNIDVRRKVKEGNIDPATLPVDERILYDGINGFISPTRELVITSSVRGWRKLDPNDIGPDVCIAIRKAHYEDIDKRLSAGESFQLEFNLEHTFTPGPIPCYNTIAEIPGTTWPNQVVVVSGHLDSWDGPGSEGCTDNGTGTATTMEAARILMAAGAKPKRTIRFIDWTGEEQGLLGSAAYVDKHKDQLIAGVSACLVDDGGTNYNGGMPAAEQMIPMLAAASAPVNNVFYSETDKKFLNVNIRNTGAKIATHGQSDHASFNRIGVPGFFWDETGRANYTHTHHTQHDKLDQAIPEYLVQSATSTAVIAYNLACADELLPRVVPETKPEANQQVAAAPPSQPAKNAVVPAKKRAKAVLP